MNAQNELPMPTRSREERKSDLDGLVSRFLFEHDLLVKRTAAILTFNGLLAATVAAGDRFPARMKMFIAVMMFVITALWMIRAVANRRLIDALNRETHAPEYADVIPAHVRVHHQCAANRWRWWFNTTNFFSIGIPIALLVFWSATLFMAVSTR